MTLLSSPLHRRHVELGAKLAEFGGWEMPLEYAGGGVLAEHKAVREGVGVFDVSHLGKLAVRGAGAAALVDRCLTNALERIGPGQAQYTLCCTPDGGVVDDLIVYRRADDDLLVIPNAANTAAVAAVLTEHAPGGVVVTDRHRDDAVIAVQGPRSAEVLERIGLPVAHDYMGFETAELAGATLTVCRTGYTGEKGYEIVVAADAAVAVWDAVMASGESDGIRPCGLGARDTLRTEMGYPLHGQDLSLDITPVMARLGWAVGWDKPEFVGRDALLAQRAEGSVPLLRGLRGTGRGIARPGMRVSAGGADVGRVTSGTFSPTLRTPVALALVDRSVSVGDEVVVDVRGREASFEVVKPPFVQPSTR
ncbi:aminomethyltransferase [Mumia flava]|uniref:Aminomethyltransferase n=1 Tax=Mumia flava TaxID=1348852 RepID=A0A0B2B2N5_9ACTN|nr:glycine cleavage system aminomethyltransferase GcvT [Mumia flava]PJJ56087.1 aminomethyltransferase [Mumia flava]